MASLQQRQSYVARVIKPLLSLRSLRSVSTVFALAVSCIGLAACNSLTANDANNQTPDVFDKIRSIELLPRSPQQEPSANTPDRRRPEIYAGISTSALAAADGGDQA